MRILVIYLLLLLSFSKAIHAQISISGQVLSANGKEPLIGAHVWKKGKYEINDVSDTNGRFILSGINKGDSLIFTFVGHKEYFLIVTQKMDSLVVVMVPISQELKMVEVKATVLGAENFAFEKLSPLDIYTNPNSKADPLVAINTSVSSTTKDENAAVSFRGASPQQTGYFLNGVPIKNPVKYAQLTNTGTLSIFNTDFLKSATVFPGNPPLEYGQATSGTVVLELADRFQDEWQHTASISMANLGYSSHGKVGEKSYLGIFGNYQFDEVLKDVNPVNFKNINSFNAMEGGALFTTHQNWGSVKIYQYGLIDNYNFNFQHPSHSGELLQKSVRSLTTAQWLQEFGNWQASVVAGNSISNNTFDFGNMHYQVENFDPYTSVHMTYAARGNLLKTGYVYWGQHSIVTGKVPTFDYALAPEHPTYAIRGKGDLESHEYYVYGRKKWGKHALGSGVRTAYIPKDHQQLWSYQLNYLQNISPHVTLKAGHGQYYQTRIDAQPQIIQQAQTSLDLDFKQNAWAVHQSFFRNHGDSSITGSESRLSFFYKNKFELDQSASFYQQNSKWEWFVRSFIKYKPFPTWTLNASFQAYKGNTYRLVTSTNYFSDLEVYAPQEHSSSIFFEPYKNFSLGASKLFQLSEKLSGVFFINVANVFDIKNKNSISYNYDYSRYNDQHLTRRSLYAGIILNFVND